MKRGTGGGRSREEVRWVGSPPLGIQGPSSDSAITEGGRSSERSLAMESRERGESKKTDYKKMGIYLNTTQKRERERREGE